MTDRLKGLTVAFDHDIRDDDAEAIINAIRQLRGVADVTGLVADHDFFIAHTRARDELVQRLWAALKDKP